MGTGAPCPARTWRRARPAPSRPADRPNVAPRRPGRTRPGHLYPNRNRRYATASGGPGHRGTPHELGLVRSEAVDRRAGQHPTTTHLHAMPGHVAATAPGRSLRGAGGATSYAGRPFIEQPRQPRFRLRCDDRPRVVAEWFQCVLADLLVVFGCWTDEHSQDSEATQGLCTMMVLDPAVDCSTHPTNPRSGRI